MTRSPFLRTKTTGRNMLPAKAIWTIRMKMIRMQIRIRMMMWWWCHVLVRGGVSCEVLDPSRNSKSNPTPTTSPTVRLSIKSFPIPRSPSDSLYPSRSSRSDPTGIQREDYQLRVPSLDISKATLSMPAGDSPRGGVWCQETQNRIRLRPEDPQFRDPQGHWPRAGSKRS